MVAPQLLPVEPQQQSFDEAAVHGHQHLHSKQIRYSTSAVLRIRIQKDPNNFADPDLIKKNLGCGSDTLFLKKIVIRN